MADTHYIMYLVIAISNDSYDEKFEQSASDDM
jgi:hypothetical protein